MQAHIIRLDQSLSMNDLESATYIILQLPNGALIRAQVDEEAAKAILESRADGEAEAPETPQPEPTFQEFTAPTVLKQPVFEAPTPTPDDDVDQFFQSEGLSSIQETPAVAQRQDQTGGAERTVEWRTLPDEVLTPSMKQLLASFNFPDVVAYTRLVSTVQDIVSKMPQPRVNPNVLQPGNGQPVGQVTFQHQRQIPPIRSVPKDDAGNPIPPKIAGQVDHSDITTGSTFDEDGVGQV